MKHTIYWLAGTIIAFGLILFSQYHRVSATADARVLQTLGYFSLPEPRQLAGVTLLDHHGNTVILQSVSDRWTLVFFGFTFCPDVCPTTLSVLNLATDRLQSPPQVIMVSVDPERDTPERLASYVTAFNPDFIGLTGTLSNIRAVTGELGIAFEKVVPEPGAEAEPYLVEHSGTVVVLDPTGQHVGYIRPPLHPETIQQILEELGLR